MDDIRNVIARLGGAAKTVELRDAGASRAALAGAVRAGLILRPRKAWYVLPSTPPPLVAAVRVGGRATCVTALREYGVWVTDHIPVTHVAVHRSAAQLRAASNPHERQRDVPDAVVHWVDTPRPRRAVGSRLLESPRDALRAVTLCLAGAELYSTVESALHLQFVSSSEWESLLVDMSSAARRLLGPASALSGSGLESYFVFGMRALGIRVQQQVQIGIDRVDVLIGERLVVELDGAGFHESHADHVRDARLVAAGYAVLRFDYRQVLHDWRSVERAVLAAVIHGDHLR